MTPEEKSLRGRIGAYALHSKGGTNTGPARAKFLSRFEDEVDPGRVLADGERQRRVAHAMKLYYSRMALKSARTRRTRKQKCRDKGADD